MNSTVHLLFEDMVTGVTENEKLKLAQIQLYFNVILMTNHFIFELSLLAPQTNQFPDRKSHNLKNPGLSPSFSLYCDSLLPSPASFCKTVL
jgi:hypothetical protein